MKSILLLLTLLPLLAPAQQNHTLSGKVTDAETGEYLIGASIMVVELMTGATTNTYGFYSLSLPEGSYTISYSYIGYEKLEYELDLTKNQVKNIEITPSALTLDEVVVSSERPDKNISYTQIGVEKLNLEDIEAIPVFFGEKDILKTIQLLPGISNSAEGSTDYSAHRSFTRRWAFLWPPKLHAKVAFSLATEASCEGGLFFGHRSFTRRWAFLWPPKLNYSHFLKPISSFNLSYTLKTIGQIS